MYYVYGYFNPMKMNAYDEPKLFYVGKGQSNRKKFHFDHVRRGHTDGNLHKCRTIKKILDAGMEPIIKIIKDGFQSEQDAHDLETLIIATVGLENVTNLTLGGEGISGYNMKQHAEKISKATKEGMAKLDPEWKKQNGANAGNARWKDKTPEEKKEESAYLQEWNRSEENLEHIRNLGRANKGRVKTPEEIERFREARTGILHTEEGKRNISEGMKNNPRLMSIVTCPACGKQGKLSGMFRHFKKCGVDSTPYKL